MAGGAHPHEMGNVEGLTEILNNHERRITENTTRIAQLEDEPSVPPPEQPTDNRAVGFGAAASGGPDEEEVEDVEELREALEEEGVRICLPPYPLRAGNLTLRRDQTIKGQPGSALTSTILTAGPGSGNVLLEDFTLDALGYGSSADCLRLQGLELGRVSGVTIAEHPKGQLDEQVEVWANNAQQASGDLTFSYCRFERSYYALLIGRTKNTSDRLQADCRLTLHRNAFYNSYRVPRVAGGATVHGVNNVAAGYSWAATEVTQGSKAVFQGHMYDSNGSNTIAMTQVNRHSEDYGRLEGVLIIGGGKAGSAPFGDRAPEIPYDLPAEPATEQLMRQVQAEAGAR